jgi:hypothetical protein
MRALMRKVLAGACLSAFAGGAHAQDHRDPSAWQGAKGWWALMDTPAPDSLLYSVDMPPGWHITAHGPGALLGDSTWTLAGPGVIETDIFLFPGQSTEGYGLFLGGSGLRSGNLQWVAVLLRRDGSVAVVSHQRGSTRPERDWVQHEAIKPGDAKDAVKNALRVDVGAETTSIRVNGKVVMDVPTAMIGSPRGVVGLRVGRGLNLHVTKVTVSGPGS